MNPSIIIKPRIMDAIYRHALSEFPREACGIVIGKKGKLESFEQIFPCRNLQNEMHAKDPEKFPRTAETAYFLDPNDLFRIQKIARNLNMEMKTIYHSHVNVGAYFSEEDKKQPRKRRQRQQHQHRMLTCCGDSCALGDWSNTLVSSLQE